MKKPDKIQILIFSVLIAGIAARVIFYFGHVFSDDAYYNYMAYTLYSGDFGKDFIGYPVCYIRRGISVLTAVSFRIFGTNEFATTVFPMLFSIVNMCLSYLIAKELTDSRRISLIVLFLSAFYPTEVLFASVNFTDMFSTVFINSGIYFLIRSYRSKILSISILAGLLLGISILFKINAFHTGLLLTALFIYLYFKEKRINKYILISLLTLLCFMVGESLFYAVTEGDMFYRFSIMQEGSLFLSNDFFREGSRSGYEKGKYLPALMKLLFIENPKAIFLRRTMLFVILAAFIRSVLFIRKNKKLNLITYWFLGLLFLLWFFTMSLFSYTPMVIRFPWYLYPLFLPAYILTAEMIDRFKPKIQAVILILYLSGGIMMAYHFRTYFDMGNNEKFEIYIKDAVENNIVYSDHFTKYSIDLIDGYSNSANIRRLPVHSVKGIPAGSIVVYHTGHISEVRSQGFEYPLIDEFQDGYEIIEEFGGFIVFKKK